MPPLSNARVRICTASLPGSDGAPAKNGLLFFRMKRSFTFVRSGNTGTVPPALSWFLPDSVICRLDLLSSPLYIMRVIPARDSPLSSFRGARLEQITFEIVSEVELPPVGDTGPVRPKGLKPFGNPHFVSMTALYNFKVDLLQGAFPHTCRPDNKEAVKGVPVLGSIKKPTALFQRHIGLCSGMGIHDYPMSAMRAFP